MLLKTQHDSADPTSGKFSYCLMCLQTIHNDQSQFEAQSLEILSDQFEVLCEYMRWSPPLKYQFDFNNDTFPFCKGCQKTLDTLHKSHQLLHELQKLIDKTVSTLSGKILLSQGDKTDIHGNKSGSSETTGSLPEESLFKRNDKINYYRDLTLQSYSVSVSVTACSRPVLVSPTEAANDTIEPLDFEPLDVANETSDIETDDIEEPDVITAGNNLCNQDTEDSKITEKDENASPILPCTEDSDLLFLNSPRIIPKTRSVTETQDEVKSLTTQLSHEKVPSEEGQREDSDYEPSIASLQNDLSDSDDVKFEDNSKTSTEGQADVKVPPKFGPRKGKFFDRVRTVGKCKYIFDEKYSFEYNSNGEWVCCTCRRQFKGKDTLLNHLDKTCEGARKLFKLIPPDKFVWTDPLDNSKTYSFERVGNTFTCNHCSYLLTSLKLMRQHVTNVHINEGATTCKTCGKFCTTKRILKNHMETHRNVPQFICELCGASFRLDLGLSNHKAVQHPEIFEKKYECEKCKRVYGTEKRLRQHKKLHDTYVCDICGKNICGVPSRLRDHMLSHGKENTFECKKCGKKFRHITSLYAHLKSHDGAKPFSCDICGMKFTQSYSVTRHKNVVHNSNKATKKNTKSRTRKQQDDSSEEDYEENSDGDQNDDDKN